jgi:hypothetical protein
MTNAEGIATSAFAVTHLQMPEGATSRLCKLGVFIDGGAFDVPNDAPNTLTYVSQDKPNMGNTVNVSNNTRINEVAAVSASLSAAASTLQLADASLSAGISSAVSVRTSQAASVSSGVSAFNVDAATPKRPAPWGHLDSPLRCNLHVRSSR